VLTDVSRITQGVIDSHIHIYTEISLKIKNAANNQERIPEANTAGIRAVCLRSHYWSTVDKAYTLRVRTRWPRVMTMELPLNDRTWF
jgi:tyrosine-protein phosphatase YwqE